MKREPFDTWQRGGSTHWGECWKGHLICALVRAVDMLDATLEELAEGKGYDEETTWAREELIQYVVTNR